MTSISSSGLTKAVEAIAAQAGVALEPCTVPWGAARYAGFRPQGLEEGEGFSIALVRTVYKAQALFVADHFAGAILRRIGAHISEELQWEELSREGAENGIHTLVTVNDGPVADVSKLETQVWRSLEIECTKRIPSTYSADTFEDLVQVGLQCLTMVLIGLDLDDPDSDYNPGAPEGAMSIKEVRKYERSRVNRIRCIRKYGTSCWVCDFDFSKTYGQIGSDFIEVHHRVPVSVLPENYRVDPVKDLIPLCSNCHSMIHKRNPVFQPNELRQEMGLAAKELPMTSLGV